ncbi:MAG: S9 family peptidase, partial [Sphingopyxis sp.]|nr:S9 family peptidase [Sphingopyxis sp.]
MRKLVILGASLLALSSHLTFAQDMPSPAPATQETATPTPAATPGSAVGSARTAPERRLTGADLFDLAIAADPQISPDGRHIA